MCLIDRKMLIGGGERLACSMVFNSFFPNSTTQVTVETQSPILLPPLTGSTQHTQETPEFTTTTKKSIRQSKGVQALPVIRKLMSSRDHWFPISSSKDYHFPGQFYYSYPQRMGYCNDVTSLGHYIASDSDFVFTDIQLGKGKCRGWNEATITIGGDEIEPEETLKVRYKTAPCNGVKMCQMQQEGCNHIVSTREFRKCPQHPDAPLVKTEGCPVEFVYIRPVSAEDHRRWLTGIDRCSDMRPDNLHTHPLHASSKIPTKVESDIREAVATNAQLKPKEVLTGMPCTST